MAEDSRNRGEKMTKGNPHKPRLDEIKTLSMLKMEKNFIAHNEKGYPRQPYKEERQTIGFLIQRIEEELNELKISHNFRNEVSTAIQEMKEECADISNLVDYLFEKLCNDSLRRDKLETRRNQKTM